MSDAFDARAELEFSLKNARAVLNDLQDLEEGIIDVSTAQERAEKRFKETEKAARAAGKAFKETGDAARAASKSAGPGSGASKEWDALAEKVREAESAYRTLSKTAAAAGASPISLPGFMSAQGISAEDLKQYRQGSNAGLLKDDTGAQRAQITKETKNWSEAEKQLNTQLRIEATERKAARDAINAQAQAEQRLNASRASAFSQPRAGSFLSQQDSGLKAADTSWAQQAKSIADASANLPRLRYALYDVATSAGVTAAAVTALGVASVAAFASMESSFTNVERTLDGVGTAGVERLRSELVGLTREIPLTFANVSEIATLGNQLGIASGDIAQFTETTAKFSAVTGLTAEASAQAFGSLGELLNVQARDYEALGSSIALVGRKSVATEAEIVTMTQRLAASATNAGFTAQQVIALSGAFASLRIAPERAQGVMETYFNRLNTAISEGGPRLEAFAKVAGVTTSEVENLVRTDPTGFFERLATGLGRMDQIAQTGALDQLGLSGIRAGEVFGRVSANVEVFNQALTDANQGWSEGTELGDQYAKVVNDLASRWQIFLNAVTEAGAAVGRILGPALGVALDLLTKMAQGFAAITNNPVGQWFVGAAVLVGVLVAAIAGLIAATTLGVASLAAMKGAITEMGISSTAGAFGLRTLGAATTQVGVAMGFSAGAIRTFKVALASTGIGLIVVALGTLAAGLWEAATASHGLSAELQPVADSLARAIELDTKTFGDTGQAIATVTRELDSSAPAADKASQAIADYVGIQDQTAASVDGATKSIKDQTIALGENADAVLRKHLAEDQGIKDIANDPALREAAAAAGFTIDQLITEALRTSGGATAYVDQIRQQAAAAHAAADQAIGDKGLDDPETQKLVEYSFALQQVAEKLAPVTSELDAMRSSAISAGNANEYVGISSEGAADGLDGVSGAAAEASENLWATQQAALGVESKMFSLGSAVGENAGMWDIFSEGGRANLGALYGTLDAIEAETRNLGGNNAAVASQFQSLYNALIAGGAATADQLAFLKTKITELAGTTSVAPAMRNFSSLFSGISSGAQKAAKSVGGGSGGLRKEIKTLVDYANDLQGVFKRAFDIRFGNQQALDSISSGWMKIADAANAAREAVEEHQRKLADLAADKSIKEYWLTVAENYGDELRAAKLRSELADISADMADEQKGLAKEQGKANKSLEGNSEAAIENRSEILGLVGDYQSYLQSLAASGMSQAQLQQKSAQLRAEFVNQAVSMGYNRTQVELYAKAFDDMGAIIAKVPRNITVSFTGDPALQAINEFAAKAKAALAGVSGAIGSSFDDSGLKKAARGYTLQAQIVALQAQASLYAGLGLIPTAVALQVQIAQISQRLNSGNYWTGGYVGDGGKYDPKGVVHGGEFVFSKAATRTIGVNNLAYMHDMAKSGKAVGPVGLGATGGMVELSPVDRSLLINIADRVGLSIPGMTFQAVTNGANANAAQRRNG